MITYIFKYFHILDNAYNLMQFSMCNSSSHWKQNSLKTNLLTQPLLYL